MPLSTDQVTNLATQGKLSETQVQNLATPVPTSTPLPVTSQTVSPTVPTNIVQPVQTSLPVVTNPSANINDAISSKYEPSAQDIAISDAMKKENELNNFIAQEGAAKLQMEADPKMVAQRKTINDLTNQFNALADQAKAIPIQIQQQFAGQGATAGGVAPIESAQTRNNAIQQLGVSSLLNAANGNLSLAMQEVDRAINAEFAPKKAELAALQANIENMKNDPLMTLAKEKRIALAEQKVKEEQAKIDEATKTKTDTKDAVLKAVSNNTGNPLLTSTVIAALQAAQSPEEVAAILNYVGLSTVSKSDALDQTYKQAQIDKMNYDLANPNRQTQVIEGANGNTLLIDTNTGATIKDYGAKKAVVDTKAPEVKTINGVDKQWNSSTQEWEDIGSQNGEVSKKISDQLDLLELSINNAETYAGASGRSGLRKTVEGVTVGATDYTNLEAQINTLKTNMLTLATDPSIKKFFGPQMSNADVRLMMSAATPADPELQDPATLKAELARLKTAVTTMKELANPGSTPGGQMYQNLVTAPDGTRIIITD